MAAICHNIKNIQYTKGELLATASQILKTEKELTGGEYAIAAYLLSLRRKSIGRSPRIAVKKAFVAYRPHNCFHFLDNTGKWTDFSYLKALDTPKQLSVRKINAALRDAIQPQIDLYRKENQVGGGKHIDHVVPFKTLVAVWLSSESLELNQLQLSKAPGRDRWVLVSDRLAASWTEYHQKNAKLEVLPAYVNMSKGGLAA